MEKISTLDRTFIGPKNIKIFNTTKFLSITLGLFFASLIFRQTRLNVRKRKTSRATFINNKKNTNLINCDIYLENVPYYNSAVIHQAAHKFVGTNNNSFITLGLDISAPVVTFGKSMTEEEISNIETLWYKRTGLSPIWQTYPKVIDISCVDDLFKDVQSHIYTNNNGIKKYNIKYYSPIEEKSCLNMSEIDSQIANRNDLGTVTSTPSIKNIAPPTIAPIFSQEFRGGNVTYHGPGQLVVYFLEHASSVYQIPNFIKLVEEAGLSSLKDIGVLGCKRRNEFPGIWIDDSKKIMQVGVAYMNNATMYGLSINLTNECLPYLCNVIPCGHEISETWDLTTVEQQLGRIIGCKELYTIIVANFRQLRENNYLRSETL